MKHRQIGSKTLTNTHAGRGTLAGEVPDAFDVHLYGREELCRLNHYLTNN